MNSKRRSTTDQLILHSLGKTQMRLRHFSRQKSWGIRNDSLTFSENNGGLQMKTGFVVALLAIAMLCASAMAQEDTANDWYKKGQSLIATGFGYNIDEALEAFDNAIQIEPQNIDACLAGQKPGYLDKNNESLEAFRNILNLTNETIKENPDDAKAWQSKGIALASLGREAEATDAFERSIELLNQSLLNDPKDAEAWWLKAENLELLGRSDSALEAYDKVIELNSSEAVGAWIRKSDIFYGLPGGYNQSQDAFGEAGDLMGVNSTSFISFWYPEGDHTIILNEWMIDGQIVRVDFGRYNRSIQAYDDLVQTRSNSGLFAAWLSKSRAITPLIRLSESKASIFWDRAQTGWSTTSPEPIFRAIKAQLICRRAHSRITAQRTGSTGARSWPGTVLYWMQFQRTTKQ